jgi:IS605 OrfB family transposase
MGDVKLIPAICPSCGANLNLPADIDRAHCMYCGTQIIVSHATSDRVECRMHQVANAVLDFAEERKAAIVLEDLKGVFKPRTNKALNRRLSMWPRRKLHCFIEYKAKWRGVTVLKVDPRNSSRKCPMCGRIQHSRKGTEFACECGWRLDRHINASLNLLNTAVSKEMAGGLRFDPGALQRDVMMTLYDPEKGARSEPNGASREEAAA